jgi:S1-C subfamily serine protease
LNAVDAIIIVAVAAAAVHGVLLGAAVQVFSFGGLAIGLVLAPSVSGLATDPTTKALLALVTLFGISSLLGAVGRRIGVGAWRGLRRAHLGRLDAALGFAVAGVAVLLAAWLLGGVLSTASAQTLASEVQRSAILRRLDHLLPPAPSVFSRIQQLINENGLPQVFAGLEPLPAARLPVPSDPTVRAAVDAGGASTLKIVAAACGLIDEGSGFVVAPGLVLTNAHVVAGAGHPEVLDPRGAHPATPILFDPRLDIALLRVSGLDESPLRLVADDSPRGTAGAALGFPGGGPFDAEPAVILARQSAVGRDIYGEGLTTRAIYELQAVIRPGNSGGPMVKPDGTVAGVIFARSSIDNNIGFALPSDEVLPRVAAAAGHTAAVSTGGCTTG